MSKSSGHFLPLFLYQYVEQQYLVRSSSDIPCSPSSACPLHAPTALQRATQDTQGNGTALPCCFPRLYVSPKHSLYFWLLMFCVSLPSLHVCFLNWGPSVQFSSVPFSRSVVSDSLRPHESQHARPPCPSPTPGVHSDSRPSHP